MTDVDAANLHASGITAVAAAGITTGCTPTAYCPANEVTRAQMASFITRAVLEAATPAPDPTPPTPPDGLVSTEATRTRIAHDEDVLGGPGGITEQRMCAVAAGGPDRVAVGVERDREAAAVWTSVDGTPWQRVPHDEAVFGGEHIEEAPFGLSI